MFTCLSCQVGFVEPEKQRDHFQTEWHRYNLRRKVAELPPLSYEAFLDRLSLQKIKEKEADDKTVYCQYCEKHFSCRKTFENHSKSKKHLKNHEEKKDKIGKSAVHFISKKIKENAIEEEIEEVDSDEWEGEPVPPTDCLFCGQHFKTLDSNLEHMSNKHSFFIPDVQFCSDVEGLLTYLGEKVGCGLMCLYCANRQFSSLPAVQHHMRDKGHCLMRHEANTIVEYSDFYDYTSSYPDSTDPSVDPEAEVSPEVLLSDGYELKLPSGVVVGHRSLLRYYKQRLNPNRALVDPKASQNLRSKIMSHYKALGWAGATAADIKRRARDVQFMRTLKARNHLHLGVKANKFQPHFRPQVMF